MNRFYYRLHGNNILRVLKCCARSVLAAANNIGVYIYEAANEAAWCFISISIGLESRL